MDISIDGTSFHSPRDKLNTGMLVEVFEGDKKLIHRKASHSSQFAFDVLETCQHKICLTPKSFYKKYFEGGSSPPYVVEELKFKIARVAIELKVGDEYLPTDVIDGGVEDMRQKVERLNGKMLAIMQDHWFLRLKEEGFRDLSEFINSRVMRWTLIQSIVLVLIGAYQLLTLERFFIKQKIE